MPESELEKQVENEPTPEVKREHATPEIPQGYNADERDYRNYHDIYQPD